MAGALITCFIPEPCVCDDDNNDIFLTRLMMYFKGYNYLVLLSNYDRPINACRSRKSACIDWSIIIRQ